MNETNWNTATLKEWVDQRFNESDKAMSAALQAAQHAVDKAEKATEKRFESVNEFRAALTDLTRSFVPRSEYEQRVKSMDATILRLEKEAALRAGAESKGEHLGKTILSIIAIILSLVGVGVSVFVTLTRH